MADRLTSAELDKMQKSVSDMTDLSKNLRDQFSKIRNTTNLLSDDFKKIISDANATNNIAQKYLVAQKVTQTLTEKINELKSKSGYLDNLSLQFKKNELDLQKKITTAQISRLIKSTALDAAAKKEAIDALKLKMILSDVELEVLEKNIGKNNSIVDSLNQQLITTESTLNNIQLIRDELISTNSVTGTLKDSFKYLLGRSGLIVKDLGKLAPFIEKGATAGSLLTEILKQGYENFKSFDKAAVSVRSNLGALPGQANKLEYLIKQVGIESMHLGVTFEDVAKSINEIANEFTGLVAQDKDLLKTTTSLSKQFGIAETTSVKFLKTLGGISGDSASSQKSMIGFAQKMAQASGVPLGKIMEDVANASDDVRVYVGSSAVSMIKAATAARMMGIDLNKAALSAEKLLQFESSISSELKASALLGQNVNFNYARQLAFNKDIIGANKEILKITKQVNFNQLNPIQQKAYADAAGKSVGELQDMLTQEKNIQLVKNGTNQQAKKALADYERMMQLKDEEAKNEGKLAEKEILRKANQEKLVQIQNKFNQLMSELAEPVMIIVDGFLTIAVKSLPYIKAALVPTLALIGGLSKYVITIGERLSTWGRAVSIFASRAGVLTRVFGSIAGYIGPIIKIFGTKIPIIGWLISGLLVIRNIFNDWSDAMENATTWGDKIAAGLTVIGSAIVKAFLPFEKVEKYVNENWLGKSPSKIGLGIVKGITSIGGLLLDALIGPFIKGYNFISKYIPGSSEMKMPSEVLSDITDDSKKRKGSINVTGEDNLLVQTIQSGNQQLVAKMDQLIAMMANGGIAVNLDGQRINAALSTTMLKSGGFGQATTRA